MSNEAFQTGFIKAALASGVGILDANKLFKYADFLGAFNNNELNPNSTATVSGLAPGLAPGLINALGLGATIGAGGLLGSSVGKAVTTNPVNERRNKTIGMLSGAIGVPVLAHLASKYY